MGELPRRRVVDVWAWLPAFRAVAEVEHVQRAAARLHVTASSLSRAIGLLEEHLGRKLFDRVGRNVRLNAHGQALLDAVGEAMRRVDDGIDGIVGTTFAGELRVGCEGDEPLARVSRAALRLSALHPELVVVVEELEARAEAIPRLLRGEIDVALVTAVRAGPRVVVDRIAEVTYGVYCGVGHPLHRARTVDEAALATHPFVAPSGTADGPGDQWPDERPRRVALRLPALSAAVAACASGKLLAVIPDSAATPDLRRLPGVAIPPSALFAVRRSRLREGPSKAGALVRELSAEAPLTAPRGRRRTAAGRSPRSAR